MREEAAGEGAVAVCGIGAGVLLLTREIDRAIVKVDRGSPEFSEGGLADSSGARL